MEPLSRRSFLRGVALAAAGLGVSGRSARAAQREKSLILIWLDGGPSQLETWDPHPGTRIGGPTRAVSTSIPGARIAALYPRVAERLHHLSVVRSLVSSEGDHERGSYLVKTGYRMDPTVVHPSLGAVLAHERPPSGLEIPSYVSLASGRWPGRGGYLGSRLDAFQIADPGRHVDNLVGRSEPGRLERRLDDLKIVTGAFAAGRAQRVAETDHARTVEAALAMMRSEQLAAFRIEEEPAAVRAAYGDHELGRGCLVARRLVEVGVRAVEVTLGGFDSHLDNFPIHAERASILDAGLSALLDDLVARDLLDRTIVLCLGEFGRTPQINALEGRDHWPHGFACLLGGGGLRSGQIIGETDPEGAAPPKEPVPVEDLAATILTAAGLDPTAVLHTPVGRPLSLSRGHALARLIG